MNVINSEFHAEQTKETVHEYADRELCGMCMYFCTIGTYTMHKDLEYKKVQTILRYENTRLKNDRNFFKIPTLLSCERGKPERDNSK